MAPLPRLITTHEFVRALQAAGVVQPDERIRRLVIDAHVENAGVLLYIERYGDERLLDIAMTLRGIEVTTGQPAAAGDQEEATGAPA